MFKHSFSTTFLQMCRIWKSHPPQWPRGPPMSFRSGSTAWWCPLLLLIASWRRPSGRWKGGGGCICVKKYIDGKWLEITVMFFLYPYLIGCWELNRLELSWLDLRALGFMMCVNVALQIFWKLFSSRDSLILTMYNNVCCFHGWHDIVRIAIMHVAWGLSLQVLYITSTKPDQKLS